MSSSNLVAFPMVLLCGAVLGGSLVSLVVPLQDLDLMGASCDAEERRAAPAPRPRRPRARTELPGLHDLRLSATMGSASPRSREGLGAAARAPVGSPPYPASPRAAAWGTSPRGEATLDRRLWDGLLPPDVEVMRDPSVAKYIRFFTDNREHREILSTWIRRSGRYQRLFDETLRAHDLPLSLAAIAYIESGLSPTARSPAGAVGLWQFMPSTARELGLVVGEHVDERRSIWKSTDAAAKHLRDLHARLRTWELALAAYNMGQPRLEKAMEQHGTDDFWTLRSIDRALPEETGRYVPKVLAIAVILRNLATFGLGHVDRAPDLDGVPVAVPAGTPLATVAQVTGLSVGELTELNPEIVDGAIELPSDGLELRVPTHALARAEVLLSRARPRTRAAPLESRGAESPATEIVTELAVSGARGVEGPRLGAFVGPWVMSDASAYARAGVRYRVQPGDTLSELARAWGIPLSRLIDDNSLGDPNVLPAGHMLHVSRVESVTASRN